MQLFFLLTQSAGAVEYTDCFSAEGWDFLNECPDNMTLNNLMARLQYCWSFGKLSSLPGQFWPGVVAADKILSMSQIELNSVLMLNWTAWDRTVLTFILRTYAELNCLKWNYFCVLNWIVWNRTVFDIETIFGLNWIAWNRTVFTLKLYLG